MFVGKALSLICYCYPASERGSKLARGWNSFSPWGDSGPSICQRKRGKMHTGRVLPMATAWAGGGAGELVDQGANCGPGSVSTWMRCGWVGAARCRCDEARAASQVGSGWRCKGHAARPQISASNADSSPTSRSFCSRFCRMRSRCAVVTLK